MMNKIVFVIILLVSTNVLSALPVTLKGKPLPSLSIVLKDISAAVVHVSTAVTAPSGTSPLLDDPDFRQFYNRLTPSQRQPKRALGSGTIVDAQKGYVLTNQHVIEGADKIQVTLKNGRKLIATLVGSDPQTDIALLQIKAKHLTEITIADSDLLAVGDFVLAIGSPYGLTQTVTSGIVSALHRSDLGFQGYEDFIQTDAATNPGNSGGPLVNLQGQLVGVNTAILSPRGSNVGIGFAVPSKTAKNIIQQIIQYGGLKRGRYGLRVENLNYEHKQFLGLTDEVNGAVISYLKAGSSAQKSGLRLGDVVLKMNQSILRSANHLHNLLGLLRVEDEVNLTVLRDGFSLQFNGKISDPYLLYQAGLTVSPYLEGALLHNYNDSSGSETIKAIAIGAVDVGSSAWRVGLREGDILFEVNKTKINTLLSLKNILKDGENMFHLRLQRQGSFLNLISPN